MPRVTEMPDDAVDLYADRMHRVALALARDEPDIDGARELLASIEGEIWVGRTRRAGRSEMRPAGPPRPGLQVPQRATALLEYGMHCSFCSGRAIPLAVLVAIGDIFPGMLPYTKTYTSATMHPVYWALAAEVDHAHAHSRGGGDGPNLQTIHALCNTAKSDLTLEQITARPSLTRHDDWDGLVAQYAPIVEVGNTNGSRQHAIGYHRDWVRWLGAGSIPREVDPGA